MRKTAVAVFLALAALSFALGVAQDYLEGGALQVAEGGQASYGIRVYNVLDQPVAFRIEPVSDMAIIHVADAQQVYQLPPRGRQEINLVVTVPEDTRTAYNPKFIVSEIKADNPNTMIDTAVSPEVSFVVKVLPKPVAPEQPGSTALTIPVSRTPAAQGVNMLGLAVGLVALLSVSLAIYHLAEKK
jgi:hypothetical protein